MRFDRKRKEAEQDTEQDQDETDRITACRNCSFAFPADLPDCNYCPKCGQDTETSRVAFGELVREAWAEFVQIDSKLIRTLSALLFKPGFLTCEYMAGKRVRYLSPFKMYLVVAALFFALTTWISRIELTQEVPSVVHAHVHVHDHGKPVSHSDLDATLSHLPGTVESYQKAQAALPADKRDDPRAQFLTERFIRIHSRWETDRAGLFADVIAFFPNMMFFLLPVYALLLRLLYMRSDWLYVEHLIFALHMHTVFFLNSTLALCLSAPPIALVLGKVPFSELIPVVLWLSFAIYGFIATRRVYCQGVFKTLLKCWFLLTCYCTVATFAVFITILYALTRV